MNVDHMAKALSLGFVPRWSIIDVSKEQSVAEHSYNVAVLSLAIGRMAKKYGVLIQYGELLEQALYHDVDEAITGDLPSTIKHEVEIDTPEQMVIAIADKVEALMFMHRYGRNVNTVVDYLMDKLNKYIGLLLKEIAKSPPTWISRDEVDFKVRQDLDQLIRMERAYERPRKRS